MRPDQRRARRRDPRPHRPQRQGTDRRGEDPEAARLAALREFGNVRLTRESMRASGAAAGSRRPRRSGRTSASRLRSLARAKGLAATVAVTLALGIGANAAIFSVVRQVLLRPLVNRDEDRLIYIRQSAPGLGTANTTFSVPEINDLRSRATTISAFGDFSTVDFTMVGLRRAARRQGRRRQRLVLRRDGPASRARPPAQRARRWPRRRGRGGPDASLLEHVARPRSVGRRQDHPPRVRAPRPWSACSSRRFRIRPTPRSSRTW